MKALLGTRILNRKFPVIRVIALSIALYGCGTKNNDITKTEEYPKIICIETSLYYGTEEKCEVIPRRAPDGRIETFIEKEIMPDADRVANFGADQGPLEYMFLEDGSLIVHIGEDWYYFKS